MEDFYKAFVDKVNDLIKPDEYNLLSAAEKGMAQHSVNCITWYVEFPLLSVDRTRTPAPSYNDIYSAIVKDVEDDAATVTLSKSSLYQTWGVVLEVRARADASKREIVDIGRQIAKYAVEKLQLSSKQV